MELHEYPRPANDTGIGIHWAAGYATATGLARVREKWLPEMRALGVKWVKIYNHDGALDLAELLLTEGFMPVVRLFRSNPNPGRLGVKEIVYLESLIRAGVSYFEFNSEPDNPNEWKAGRLPANALDLVAENAIADMETILERGGMPAIPALAGSSSWDIVGRIVKLGRRDLFDGPVWQAIHNYPRNRPLEYPFDIGNQEGSAYTDRFYRVVADEEWGEHAWRGRSLVDVNRLRLGRANPGASIADDHDCFLAFRHYDALNVRHLGRNIPILSTECGYIVGEDLDPRYPATTPELHMAQTLESCRIMMGTSQRFDRAPDYYFCTAFWLIANRDLGSTSEWWEGHAWYSHRWPNGALPITRALRVEPKVVRQWQKQPVTSARICVQGLVAQPAEREFVVVEENEREIGRAAVDGSGRYRVDDLPPGRYKMRLHIGLEAQEVTLSADQRLVIVNFDSRPQATGFNKSVVDGTVSGGAGAVVVLRRQSDGEEWVGLAHEDGRFRFVDLSAGTYSVRIHTQGSRVDGILLDGRNSVDVRLVNAGWGYTIRHLEDDPSAHAGALCCIVEGHKGVAIHAEQGVWRSDSVQSGSAPEYGPYAAKLTGLESGDYLIRAETDHESGVDGALLEARVQIDRKRLPVLTFVHNVVPDPVEAARSTIAVTLTGGQVGKTVTLVLIDEKGERTPMTGEGSGPYLFEGLAEGRYAVEVVGHEAAASQSNIVVDGLGDTAVRLQMPAAPGMGAAHLSRSRVIGRLPGASGALAILADEVGNEFSRVVDDEDHFVFDGLPPGLYSLQVEGGYVQSGIQVNGTDGVEVTFSPLAPTWHAEQSNAGAMPGFSTLRVEVEGQNNLPVNIWQDDGVSLKRRTGEAEGLDADVAEFRPLEAGIYLVEPEGLDVRTEVELTGLETVWISFQERLEPVEPNLVRQLDASDFADPVWEAADDGNHAEPHAPGEMGAGAENTYIFLGDGDVCSESVATLLTYVATYQPRMGRDIDEASKADQVLVVGHVDPATVSLLELQVGKLEQLS